MRKPADSRHELRSQGFTLIEMIVSVTLIAIMSLALWSVLRISISSWKRGTESMDENQRHRATLDLMQKQMASVSAIIPALDLQLGIGQFPIFSGTETAVQFLSQCPLRFRENPGLAFISYEIVSATEGEFSLVEHETRYLGGDPTQTVSFGASAPSIAIFDHLSSAVFQYLDPGDDQNPPQWVSFWNSGDTGTLPAAISLRLSSRDSSRTVVNRQIIVPLMAEPDNMQGFIDPFDGRGGRGIRGGPGGPGGPGDGRGRGGDRRGGPGDAGRGRGGPGMGPGGPGRGFGPGFDFGRGRGPGITDPGRGGRRGGRF